MKNGSHQVGKVEVEEGDYYIYLTHIYIFESLQKTYIFISECCYLLLVRKLSPVFISLNNLGKVSKMH